MFSNRIMFGEVPFFPLPIYPAPVFADFEWHERFWRRNTLRSSAPILSILHLKVGMISFSKSKWANHNTFTHIDRSQTLDATCLYLIPDNKARSLYTETLLRIKEHVRRREICKLSEVIFSNPVSILKPIRTRD